VKRFEQIKLNRLDWIGLDLRSMARKRGRNPMLRCDWHIRFGSKADISQRDRHVRFTPKADIRHATARAPFECLSTPCVTNLEPHATSLRWPSQKGYRCYARHPIRRNAEEQCVEHHRQRGSWERGSCQWLIRMHPLNKFTCARDKLVGAVEI